MRQILWSLFKKIVIADNLGHFVDRIYRHYDTLHGIELALGTVSSRFKSIVTFLAIRISRRAAVVSLGSI